MLWNFVWSMLILVIWHVLFFCKTHTKVFRLCLTLFQNLCAIVFWSLYFELILIFKILRIYMLKWKSQWISLIFRWISESFFLSTFWTSVLGISYQSLIIWHISWFCITHLVGSNTMVTLPLLYLQFFIIPITQCFLTTLLSLIINL